MKIFLVILLGLLISGTLYAETTYEKVTDGIFKKTITTPTVTTDNKTITQTKEEIIRLQKDNEQALIDYNLRVERNNTKIAELEKDITEAKKAGCFEITPALNIIE